MLCERGLTASEPAWVLPYRGTPLTWTQSAKAGTLTSSFVHSSVHLSSECGSVQPSATGVILSACRHLPRFPQSGMEKP